MADEYHQLGSGNWWDSSRNRFDSGSTVAAAASTSSNSSININMGSFGGWPTEMTAAGRSSLMDHSSHQKLQQQAHESSSSTSSAAGIMLSEADNNLQLMGLALSSQTMDWNHQAAALFPAEKAAADGSSFRSMLQEESGSVTISGQDHHQWRSQKLYGGGGGSPDDNSEFKPMNQRGASRGVLSLDNSTCAQAGLSPSNFQVESAASNYGASPNSILQGLLVPDHHHQQQSMNYSYPSSYVMENSTSNSNNNNNNQLMPPPPAASNINPWSKFPQFLRTSSPPKQQPSSSTHGHGGHLHFSNNTPFWNASSTTGTNDVRSSCLFPASLQTQVLPVQNFEEKSKNTSEIRDSGVTKKSGTSSSSDASNKRPRNETPAAPMPAFKVRKEKMGDRITALQQLVSPFGKTDTASVLSEAIEYIKLLHDQVNVLSTPYMKSGAPMQHQQNSEKSKDSEGPKQDLRSRGLCLVPVSSTFPVTHETAVDFWSPTFGGTFR